MVRVLHSMVGVLCLVAWGQRLAAGRAEAPFFECGPIFPTERFHNHASSIVETPQGHLLVCWFHGTGERTADDVEVRGARLRRRGAQWTAPFVMADTPGFPDCNPMLFVDPRGELWFFHVTILANTWESALLKCRVSSDFEHDGPPHWKTSDVITLKPGKEFTDAVQAALPEYERSALAAKPRLSTNVWREVEDAINGLHAGVTNKLYCRLGWMTRVHPLVLDGKRLVLPLYHDGFSCSLFAITDDWGNHWHTSLPLIGGGNIQPSLALRRDGSLFTIMRDNGPPPHRAMSAESRDRGETWSSVVDTEIPNPGSSLEVVVLQDHRWVLVGNDSETNRRTLAAWTSDDEGRSWVRRRTLAKPDSRADSFSYPSVIQSRDGHIHLTFSASGGGRSTILHGEFNEGWLMTPETR